MDPLYFHPYVIDRALQGELHYSDDELRNTIPDKTIPKAPSSTPSLGAHRYRSARSPSLWSRLSLPNNSITSKAWSVFLSTPRRTEVPTASGRLFAIDRDWSVYCISLDDLSGSLIAQPPRPPPTEQSLLWDVPLLIDDNGDFILLLSRDLRILYSMMLNIGMWSTSRLLGGPGPQHFTSPIICSARLYVFGGSDQDLRNLSNNLWRLDLEAKKFSSVPRSAQDPGPYISSRLLWKKVPSSSNQRVPPARRSHKLLSDGSRLYLCGGFDTSNEILMDTWVHNIGTTTWTELPCTGAVPHPEEAMLIDDVILTRSSGLDSKLAALRISCASSENLGSSSCGLELLHISDCGQLEAPPTLMIYYGFQIFSLGSAASRTAYVLDARLIIELHSGKRLIQVDLLSVIRTSLRDLHFHLIKISSQAVNGGGFCDIFIGKYTPSSVKLALKRPRSAEAWEDVIRRFHREAGIWSTLHHINILPFLGVMDINPETYLVSPWMERGDLSTFMTKYLRYFDLESQAPDGADPIPDQIRDYYLSFSEKRTIYGIASGVAYLHSVDFVHGDLKAKNVLLAEDGQPLLCDFGMSKALDSTSALTSTRMKGVGTLRWQSPELFMNESKTAKSDVYAFGMIIVEVLTGTHPLPNLTDMAFMNLVANLNKRPLFEPSSRRGVDFQPLWDVAARCWAKDPKDRPSMEIVLEELKTGD